MGAAKGVVLERARKREKEKQRCTFAPCADTGASDRNGQHQEMHVVRSWALALPDFVGREPTTGQIREHVRHCRVYLMSPQQVITEAHQSAKNRSNHLRFPLIDLRLVL